MSSNYPGVPPQFASSFDTLTRVTTTLETQGKLHSIRPPRSISAYNEILNYQLLPYHAAIVWNKSILVMLELYRTDFRSLVFSMHYYQ